MSDYKQHPDDNIETHSTKSLIAMTNARPTNRFYVFPMVDRVEIAFGNARHSYDSERTQASGDGYYVVNYHSAVSMDFATVRELQKMLTRFVEDLDKEDG